MKNRQLNPLLLIGLLGTLSAGTSFIANVSQAFWGNHEIWWTPQAMRIPIGQTNSSFDLYIAGKPLQKHLSEGLLYSVSGNGEHYRVAPADIDVRLNNWDRMKASFLTKAAITGPAFGAALALLVIGLVQVLAPRKAARRYAAGAANY